MNTYYKVQAFVDNKWCEVSLCHKEKLSVFAKCDRKKMWEHIKLSFPLFHYQKFTDPKIKKIRVVPCDRKGRSNSIFPELIRK